MQTVAIIAAGGVGKRMGRDQPKQFLPLAGRPLLAHTIQNLAQAACLHRLILVVRAEDMDFCRNQLLTDALDKPVVLVEGGQQRSDSVYAGLQATRPDEEIVLVHDAARPFIRPALVERVAATAHQQLAAIAAVPVKETIKMVRDGVIVRTPDRTLLWRAQTPQAFRRTLLLEAYAAWDRAVPATDEAMLVEALGVPVRIVAGDESNIKVTTPEDLTWSEWHMATQKQGT